jgi:hypothetical protein
MINFVLWKWQDVLQAVYIIIIIINYFYIETKRGLHTYNGPLNYNNAVRDVTNQIFYLYK